jgi:hypothetical protein
MRIHSLKYSFEVLPATKGKGFIWRDLDGGLWSLPFARAHDAILNGHAVMQKRLQTETAALMLVMEKQAAAR